MPACVYIMFTATLTKQHSCRLPVSWQTRLNIISHVVHAIQFLPMDIGWRIHLASTMLMMPPSLMLGRAVSTLLARCHRNRPGNEIGGYWAENPPREHLSDDATFAHTGKGDQFCLRDAASILPGMSLRLRVRPYSDEPSLTVCVKVGGYWAEKLPRMYNVEKQIDG